MAEGVPNSESAVPARRASWSALAPAFALAAVAFLAHMCVSFGLVVFASRWVAPLLIGGISAVAVRSSSRHAAAGTAAGLTLGLAIADPGFLSSLSAGLGDYVVSRVAYVLLAAVAGGITARALGGASRRGRVEWIASVVLVTAIVGVMWITVGLDNARVLAGNERSLNRVLSVRPETGEATKDHEYYLRIFYDMHAGGPYYESYVTIFLADPTWEQLPVGVTGYRLPTLFYLWRLLPPDGATLPWGFLVFASLGVVAAFSIGVQLSCPGTAVLGALMVSAACLLIATTTWVTFVDGWAMAVSVVSVALFIASVRRESRGLLWAAVSAALAAAALRELLVYPMVLAAASALLLPTGRRWRALWPWLAGIGCFAAIYSAHVAAIAGRVNPETGYGFWLQGGPGHSLATAQFFSQSFGGNSWFVPVLVVTGLAGAVVVRRSEPRLSAFLVAAIAGPLLVFLVVGNGGKDVVSGEPTGYWGMLYVPLALAMVPPALAQALRRARGDV